MHIDTPLKFIILALPVLIALSAIPAVKDTIQPIDITLRASYLNAENKYPLYIYPK